MWADRRVLDLFGIEHPILLSPMANAGTIDLAIAVGEAGGLGAVPCGMIGPEQIRNSLDIIRRRMSRPINLNFFCHRQPSYDAARDARWATVWRASTPSSASIPKRAPRPRRFRRSTRMLARWSKRFGPKW